MTECSVSEMDSRHPQRITRTHNRESIEISIFFRMFGGMLRPLFLLLDVIEGIYRRKESHVTLTEEKKRKKNLNVNR